MPEQEGYSPRNHAERIIATGRLFLSGVLTLAVLLGIEAPAGPAITKLAVGYFVYALLVAAFVWTRSLTPADMPAATHVLDLIAFTSMGVVDGTSSLLFSYFIFSTLAGAIRWHGRGALVTGGAGILLYLGSTLVGAQLFATDRLEPARLLTHTGLLALVAGLLTYLGDSQRRLKQEIASLAAWPRRLSMHRNDALDEILAYAGSVLKAPRVVLVWEEADEPALRVAARGPEGLIVRHERPDAFGTIVAESLVRSSFAVTATGSGRDRVLQRVPGGFRLWRGTPLDDRFRERFGITHAIALRLSLESVRGWLFALDRPRAWADELLLGDIVGRLVAGALELQSLLEQLRESAVGEERLHLARDLHDGVLQALTAASLQAQRARQSLATAPHEAERRIAMVEETILTEQQALRHAIEGLKPGAIGETVAVEVVPRLRDAAMRVARQWDVQVHLDLQPEIAPLPQQLAHELMRMVQEAAVNAIRHGGARELTVTCAQADGALSLSVSYEGRGFAGFDGRHDLASLNRMKVGPRTLKERVAAVGGSLVIDSSETGARVEIRVPAGAVS